MKNISFVAMCLLWAGCVSTSDLKQAGACNVWQENSVFGAVHRQVANREVTGRGDCYLYFWLCTESRTDIDQGGSIYHKGKGPFSSRTKIAHIEGSKVIYESSIMSTLVASEPIDIDMERRKILRRITVKALNLTSEETLEFNKACSIQEAAVGAINLWIASK